MDAKLNVDSITTVNVPGYAAVDTNASTLGTPGNVDATIDQLQPGDSLTIRVTATVLDTISQGEIIANTSDLTYTSLPGTEPEERDGSDGAGGLNDYVDTDTVDFTTASNFALTKTAPAEATIGETVTYTLELELIEGTTTGVTVTDTLPDNLDFVSGTVAVTFGTTGTTSGYVDETNSVTTGADTVTINLGDVVIPDSADPDTVTITFDALVMNDSAANNNGDVKTNNAEASDDDSQTDTDTANTTIVEPTPSITKTFTPAIVEAGGTVEMLLVVDNLAANGATSTLYDITVTDILDDWLDVTGVSIDTTNAPSATANDNSTITAGFAAGVTDDILIDIDQLAVDEVVEITVTMQVDPSVTDSLPRTITNTADITGDTLPGDVPEDRDLTDDDTADLGVQAPNLVVSKLDSADPVNAGDSFSYTITVENTGTPDIDATNVQLTDTLPPDITVDSVTPSQGTCNPVSGGAFTCDLDDLASGASATITVDVTVDSTVTDGTTLTNTATVTSDQGNDGTGTDDDGDDARATEDTTVGRAVDLQITKTVDVAGPVEGETVTYTLEVANLGPSDATGVTVTDVFPAGVTYSSDTGGADTSYDGTDTLTWTIGDLANGDTATIDVVVTVDAGTSGDTIDNVASVTRTEPDVDPSNNDDNAEITVDQPDVALTKTVDNATPAEGDTVVYTLEVVNNGPGTVTGVQVTDNLPADVTYDSDDSGSTSTTYTDTTGVWDVGTLAEDETVTLNITVTVDSTASAQPQPISNTAVVTIDQNDSDTTNNEDTADITVGGADLGIEKVVDNNSPDEGDTVVYTLTLTNTGPSDATNITVTDALPAGVTYDSSNAATLLDDDGNPTSYDDTTGEWTIGRLDVGSSLALEITATVDSGTSGDVIDNVATITALDQNDGDNTNNEDNAEIGVNTTDISVTKTVSTSVPSEGDTITYSVTAENVGLGAATGVTIADTLPQV